MELDDKRVLVTGGTGSLGQALVRRLLAGELGQPRRITVFSRDEAKQHYMRLSYLHRSMATDEVIYRNFQDVLAFRIGDVRDYAGVVQAVRQADVIFHAAALKQVPACEYFPFEAVQTNILGTENLIRAIRENDTSVEKVVGVSTDKACKPINTMGMTKAVMERLLIAANLDCPMTRFVCVRYGNVICSRGSVIPLFLDQIASGGPVTITLPDMTRFLLSLQHAVDTCFDAFRFAGPGETVVPRVPSGRIVDIAQILINGRKTPVIHVGIRPGEKVHEILVSEEERYRTSQRGDHYVIHPAFRELGPPRIDEPLVPEEYSSALAPLDREPLRLLLAAYIDGEAAPLLTA